MVFFVCRVLFFVLIFFSSAHIFSQDKKTKKVFQDFINIKTTGINYAVPDTATLHDEGQTPVRVNKKPNYFFDPFKHETNLGKETDSNRVDPEDFSIVEVDEEFNPNEEDSLWIKIAQYYSVWDNKAVNPYGIDVTKFTDSIKLALYDSSQNRFWSPPLKVGFVNDDFGMRRYRWHYGCDLDLNTGDSVLAVFDGIVRIRKYDYGGYGNYIVVRHFNGLETIYGHLSKQLAEVGALVKAGSLIGWGGSTGRSSGPHLHFEIRYQGYAIDPELFFNFRENKLMWKEFMIRPEHFAYLKRARKVYFHRVRRGDTLSEIAERYNVGMRQIMRLNKLSSRTMLRLGRRLRVR